MINSRNGKKNRTEKVLFLSMGGMPQAVAKFVETRDFNKVDRVKRQILKKWNGSSYE